MKIVHCCLAAFYIDDYGYQENILPQFHKRMGHDVEILASTETYIDRKRLGYTKASSYVGNDGLHVTRLPYVGWLPQLLGRKLRIYKGIGSYLNERRPDVIFVHDCQFVGIDAISRYASHHDVTVFVDSHTDFVNSGRTWISRYLLNKLIYRWCAKRIEPRAEKFFPTLPLRAEFLRDVYDIAPGKMELLPFGVDDSDLDFSQRSKVRAAVRQRLGIGSGETVFVTGGKIDRRKNIHVLGRAFLDSVRSLGHSNARLVIFGTPSEEMNESIAELALQPSIKFTGWLSPAGISDLLWAADVAVFPGTHSVIWEQAVGLGVPCVFLRWPGIEHVDLGGNCLFLEQADEASIRTVLSLLLTDPKLCCELTAKSAALGPETFRYSRISLRALGHLARLTPSKK